MSVCASTNRLAVTTCCPLPRCPAVTPLRSAPARHPAPRARTSQRQQQRGRQRGADQAKVDGDRGGHAVRAHDPARQRRQGCACRGAEARAGRGGVGWGEPASRGCSRAGAAAWALHSCPQPARPGRRRRLSLTSRAWIAAPCLAAPPGSPPQPNDAQMRRRPYPAWSVLAAMAASVMMLQHGELEMCHACGCWGQCIGSWPGGRRRAGGHWPAPTH